MRGDLVNLNFKAFNEQFSGLIVKCFEIPHYAYSSRCRQLVTAGVSDKDDKKLKMDIQIWYYDSNSNCNSSVSCWRWTWLF